jgi:murein L,D-transpeptidase YafK
MARAPRCLLAPLAAAAVLASTSGCQIIGGFFPGLFGPRPAPPKPAASRPPPAPPLHADRVVVFKRRRQLELLQNGRVVASFPIALGEHPRGPKRQEGDGRTPEGVYLIDRRSMETRYTRELHISYPSESDRASAEKRQVEPGGAIFIHGLPRDYGPFDPPRWYRDWTDGCIAVGNAAIVKIWDAAPTARRSTSCRECARRRTPLRPGRAFLY